MDLKRGKEQNHAVGLASGVVVGSKGERAGTTPRKLLDASILGESRHVGINYGDGGFRDSNRSSSNTEEKGHWVD